MLGFERVQTLVAHAAQHCEILQYLGICFDSTVGVLQSEMVRRCQALLRLQVLPTGTLRHPASQHQTTAWQEVL